MKYLIWQILFLTFTPALDSRAIDLKTLETIKVLAKLINSEAHAETYVDKLLVGSVVLNRLNHKEFPSNIFEVIYQPGQFDGINNSMYTLTRNNIQTEESILAAAYLVEHGSILPADIVYFLNPKKTKDKVWFKKIMPNLYYKSENIWYFRI